MVWTFSHIIARVACGISRWSVDVFLAAEPREDHSSTANKVPDITIPSATQTSHILWLKSHYRTFSLFVVSIYAKEREVQLPQDMLEHHYGYRFIVLGLWTPIWPPWRHIANGHHPREIYNTRHKSLKQTPFVLNFVEHFLHSLFALLFSLKCAPLLPQYWRHNYFEALRRL